MPSHCDWTKISHVPCLNGLSLFLPQYYNLYFISSVSGDPEGLSTAFNSPDSQAATWSMSTVVATCKASLFGCNWVLLLAVNPLGESIIPIHVTLNLWNKHESMCSMDVRTDSKEEGIYVEAPSSWLPVCRRWQFYVGWQSYASIHSASRDLYKDY